MRKVIAAILFALLLGGCMMGPDYFRPFVQAPEGWRVTDQDARDLANSAWWEQFDDPVLNDLIGIALRENKNLLLASARIEEAAARLGVTRSQLYPQAGLGYSASQQRNIIPGTSVKALYDTYDTALSLSWEIDLWGRIRRQSEASRAQLIASQEGRQGVILSLVASVATSYISLRDLDAQLEVASETANSRGDTYQLFQDRYAAGTISILELAQNKSQYEDAVATIPALEKSVAQQENALSILLGRNPGPIPRGKSIGDLVVPAIPAGLPSTLLERRPDIRQAEQSLISANALIGAAKAAYFPSISLTALTGVTSAALSTLYSNSSRFWQNTGALSQPLFAGGALSGQVDIANAQQQQALISYQQAIQNAFSEVNNALIDRDRTRVQLAAQRRELDALIQYAEMARLRYDNGYTDYSDVLDAERSLFSVRLQYTQTQQTLLLALVNLYKAMGGGWVGDADKLTVSAEKERAR